MTAAPAPAAPPLCFHCGLPIPPDVRLRARVAGALRPMCCAGCVAVAELLEARGLSAWYRRRASPTEERAASPEALLAELPFADEAALERTTTRPAEEGGVEASLIVEGMRCAACVWVIEQHLGGLPGVRRVAVDLLSRRVRVVWSPEQVGLRAVIGRLAEIGFRARPDRPGLARELDRREARASLVRLGIAGLGTMNVMTYAVALYLGVVDGMEPGVRALLRWLCLLVATPVVFLAARPFFAGALRDLRLRRPGMDVPVALAIGGAYGISAFAVWRGEGEIYLDSACMFTFFLSLGRHLELRIRLRSASLASRLARAVPPLARRLPAVGAAMGAGGVGEEVVATSALRPGDRFVVRPGEAIATDGAVVTGRSAVEEALLTGESWPRRVAPGARVLAGSLNVSSPLVVRATHAVDDSKLSGIVALVERAAGARPPIARLADRLAARFVVFVLLAATAAAAFWGWADPERAVDATLAVLVATCPCALGLATPAALAAATETLARRGLLITRGHVIEGLARADRVVLDKTGTLTAGRPRLVGVIPLGRLDERAVVVVAARLEARSEHPVARAVRDAAAEQGVAPDAEAVPDDLVAETGFGVEGSVDGERLRLGRPDWAMALSGRAVPSPPKGASAEAPRARVLLADGRGAIAWLELADPLRESALEGVEALRRAGLAVEMLSGDPDPAARRTAERLGLEVARSAALPAEKVARIEACQRAGEVVVTVGDGVNDGPLMRIADVSIAMGGGVDLTREAADALLLRDDLAVLPEAIGMARRTRRVIRQGFGWALGYNLGVLPLALAGWLPPWLAALGMSASSLVVVLNATRLARGEASGWRS